MSDSNNGAYHMAMGMSNDMALHNVDMNGVEEEDCGVEGMPGEREDGTNEGEDMMGDEGDEPQELSPEVLALTRQAEAQLGKTYEDTKQLLNGLHNEIIAFLEVAEGVQKDFLQVQMAVHEEAARLDNLEPQVENATNSNSTMMNGGASTSEDEGQKY